MKMFPFYRLAMAIALVRLTSIGWAGVPVLPSSVTVQGTQLIVQKRLSNGSLSRQVPYTIKGVDWSPATRAPATGPIPPGYPSPTASSNQYGFFFHWPGRNPDGPVVMNYWFSNENQAHYQQDIPLMAQMHINTVRIYNDFGTDPAVYKLILDTFYNNGIMVIMTVVNSQDDIASRRYLQTVQLCQNHPAILMWLLGNEWNLNNPPLYGYSTYAQAAAAVENAAVQIKALDPNHPVSSSLGDAFSPSFNQYGEYDVPAIVPAIPDVDIWNLNIYRGASFGILFGQWAAISSKPFYFGEFGTDSFRTTNYTSPGNGQAKVSAGYEDQPMQSNFDLALWREIQSQLSIVSSTNSCTGGLIWSWNDHLWKVGNYNVGLGGLVNYNGPDGIPGTADDDTSYNAYNPDGFALAANPDGVANEEYWGVVNADRVPKQAYMDLQAYYAALAPLPMGSIEILPSSVALHYNQSQNLTAVALDVFEEPVYLQPSSFTWSVSPSTGVSISTSGIFTSFASSGTYWVMAQSGLFTSSIAVVVANAPPTITQAASAASNPVRSTSTVLSVQADDDLGEAGLAYTWSTAGIIPGPVQFLDLQGLNSSKTMSVVFASPGQYVFVVTVQDQDGAQTTSQVVVQVEALSTPSRLPGDFAALRVFPSPWRSDLHMGHDIIFDGLTANTTVKIFTVSGHWVRTLGPGDGMVTWNLKNDSGDLVASGLYFYLITNDLGQKGRGKLAIIR